MVSDQVLTMENNVFSLISLIADIILAGGFIWIFFKKGGDSASQEVINIYQIRDKEQKQQIADYQLKFDNINKELGKLNGIIQEKDVKLKEYIDILSNRNPKLEATLNEISEYLKKLQSMEITVKIPDTAKN